MLANDFENYALDFCASAPRQLVAFPRRDCARLRKQDDYQIGAVRWSRCGKRSPLGGAGTGKGVHGLLSDSVYQRPRKRLVVGVHTAVVLPSSLRNSTLPPVRPGSTATASGLKSEKSMSAMCRGASAPRPLHQ